MQVNYVNTSEKFTDAITIFSNINKKWVGLDTETTGLNSHSSRIRLVQLSIDENVYLFDAFILGRTLFEWLDSYLKETYRENIYAGHNLKFDMQHLWKAKVDISVSKLFDTMLATQILEAGLLRRFGLGYVVERYLNIDMNKDEQTSDWSITSLSRNQIIYAAYDPYYTAKLARVLESKLKTENLTTVFKLEMATLPCTACMEYYGVRLDVNVINDLRPLYETRLKNAENDFISCLPVNYKRFNFLDELIDKGIELSSSSQVLEALRSMNIPDPIEDGLITSTGANVVKLLDVVDYPVLNNLLEYRKVSKLLTSYIYNLPELVNPDTGRLHCHFNQLVKTGRMSSSSPL